MTDERYETVTFDIATSGPQRRNPELQAIIGVATVVNLLAIDPDGQDRIATWLHGNAARVREERDEG